MKSEALGLLAYLFLNFTHKVIYIYVCVYFIYIIYIYYLYIIFIVFVFIYYIYISTSFNPSQ